MYTKLSIGVTPPPLDFSAYQSNKKGPPERSLDSPFFRFQLITSLKNHVSEAQSDNCPVILWVAGNEVIVKNVNANIPVSLSWLLLLFLAFLCFPASAQSIDSSLQWLNGQIQFTRAAPLCRENELGHCRLESMD